MGPAAGRMAGITDMSGLDPARFPFLRVDAQLGLVFGRPVPVGSWVCTRVELVDDNSLEVQFNLPRRVTALHISVMPVRGSPPTAARLHRCAVRYRVRVDQLDSVERQHARAIVMAVAEELDERWATAGSAANLAGVLGREPGPNAVRFDPDFVRRTWVPSLRDVKHPPSPWSVGDIALVGDRVVIEMRRDGCHARFSAGARDDSHSACARSRRFDLIQLGVDDDAIVPEARLFLTLAMQVCDGDDLDIEFPSATDNAIVTQPGGGQGDRGQAPQACAGMVALVTGASRGIGAAIATRLAAEGARVAIAARSLDSSSPELPGTLHQARKAAQRNGSNAVALQADIAIPSSREKMISRCEALLGPIDILVNNAAYGPHGPLLQLTDDDYHLTFETNVGAVFHLCRLVLPGMRERRRGWILNISSGTGLMPEGPPYGPWQRHGGHHLYAASKAALTRLTAGFAAEAYEDGIAVNALAPRLAVQTPGFRLLGNESLRTDDRFEPVEAIAEAAVVLCSCDPAQMSGGFYRSLTLLEELQRPIRGLDGTMRT